MSVAIIMILESVRASQINVGAAILRIALLCTFAIIVSNEAQAQYVYGQPPQPTVIIDDVEVNLYTGVFSPSEPNIKIGDEARSLEFSRAWTKDGWRHNYLMYASVNYDGQSQSSYVANVITGFGNSVFSINYGAGGAVYFVGEDGTTLVDNDPRYASPNLVWTDKSGNKFIFSESSVPASDISLAGIYTLLISKIEYASGYVVDFNYESTIDSTKWPPIKFSRLSSVTSNSGYMIKFRYRDSIYNNVLTDYSRAWRWSDITQVKLLNMAYEKCPKIGNVCNTSLPWRTLSRQLTWTGAIDDGAPLKLFTETINISGIPQRVYNISWEYSPQRNSTYITNVARGGSAPQTTSISYIYPNGIGPFGVDPYVNSVNKAGQTWSYSFSNTVAPVSDVPTSEYALYHFYEAPSAVKTTRTDAAGKQRTFYGTSNGETLMYVDEIGRKTRYSYLSNMGPTRWAVKAFYPEGDSFLATLDTRYNVVSLDRVAKPGSGLLTISRTAAYPPSCDNATTCNQPISITSGKNEATDYSYEPTHGGLKSATMPSDAEGRRAQVRHTYVQRNAWILSDAGGYERVEPPIWVIASDSTCVTSSPTGNPASPCAAGSTDEVVTTYDYGPDSGPNNLLLRGITVTSNGTSMRTCYRYDEQGRKIAETKPNALLGSCP
jgi:hypothetical protein